MGFEIREIYKEMRRILKSSVLLDEVSVETLLLLDENRIFQ